MGVLGDFNEEGVVVKVAKCIRMESILELRVDWAWERVACVWVRLVWL